MLQIQACGIIEPDVKPLQWPDALSDGIGQSAFEVRIVCADAAHGDLLSAEFPFPQNTFNPRAGFPYRPGQKCSILMSSHGSSEWPRKETPR